MLPASGRLEEVADLRRDPHEGLGLADLLVAGDAPGVVATVVGASPPPVAAISATWSA